MLVAKRVGFLERPADERVLVLQVDDLNAVLPTTIVAPVVPAIADDENDPRTVELARDESGAAAPMVVVLTQLHTLPLDRLDRAVGSLRPETRAAVDDTLGLVLGLGRAA